MQQAAANRDFFFPLTQQRSKEKKKKLAKYREALTHMWAKSAQGQKAARVISIFC